MAVLGFRALSQFKHLPNAAIGVAEIGGNNMVKGLSASVTPKGTEFIKKNFAEISQRFGGEQSIAELEQGRTGLLGKAQKFSFILERAIDSTLAKASVLGIDSSKWAELPLNEEAAHMALVDARKVVTSPLVKDIPQAVSRGALTGNNMSYAKALFQFQNTMLRQAGYLKHDIFDLGVRNLDGYQFAKTALGFLAMIAAETEIVKLNRELLGSKANPDREDSFAQDAALEVTKRVPFVGNVLAMAKKQETGIPMVDTVVQTTNATGRLMSGKNDFGTRMSRKEADKAKIDAATGLAGLLGGLPGASVAAQAMKNKL